MGWGVCFQWLVGLELLFSGFWVFFNARQALETFFFPTEKPRGCCRRQKSAENGLAPAAAPGRTQRPLPASPTHCLSPPPALLAQLPARLVPSRPLRPGRAAAGAATAPGYGTTPPAFSEVPLWLRAAGGGGRRIWAPKRLLPRNWEN